jgi:hypothetical protein
LVRVGGIDRTDRSFDLEEQDADVEVTFTDRTVTMSLTGIERDAQGRPIPNAAVLIFPVGSRRVDRLRRRRSNDGAGLH